MTRSISFSAQPVKYTVRKLIIIMIVTKLMLIKQRDGNLFSMKGDFVVWVHLYNE